MTDASTAKRDFIKEWLGEWVVKHHPSDAGRVKEFTQTRLRELSDPDFENAGRVHDWRNHVGEATQSIWGTLTDQQKAAIALDADERASREEWE